jgi:hypothetical protein
MIAGDAGQDNQAREITDPHPRPEQVTKPVAVSNKFILIY